MKPKRPVVVIEETRRYLIRIDEPGLDLNNEMLLYSLIGWDEPIEEEISWHHPTDSDYVNFGPEIRTLKEAL